MVCAVKNLDRQSIPGPKQRVMLSCMLMNEAVFVTGVKSLELSSDCAMIIPLPNAKRDPSSFIGPHRFLTHSYRLRIPTGQRSVDLVSFEKQYSD